MSGINTVIFDMDGTLLNSLEDITDSVNYILGKHGLPERKIDEVRFMVGNGAAYLMERAVAGGKDHPDFAAILEEYQIYYHEHCNIKTRPYEHISQMLTELKKRGFKLAIVSNKPMEAVEELNRIYFADFMDAAIGVRDGIRRKPYPDECMEALKILGSRTDEAVYVGDSETDYKTAKNSGLKCINCLWGFRTKEELIDAGATDSSFVNDPLEILELI